LYQKRSWCERPHRRAIFLGKVESVPGPRCHQIFRDLLELFSRSYRSLLVVFVSLPCRNCFFTVGPSHHLPNRSQRCIRKRKINRLIFIVCVVLDILVKSPASQLARAVNVLLKFPQAASSLRDLTAPQSMHLKRSKLGISS